MSEESSALPLLLAGVCAFAVAYVTLAGKGDVVGTSAAPSVRGVPVVTTPPVVPPTPAVSATVLSSAPVENSRRRRVCAAGDACEPDAEVATTSLHPISAPIVPTPMSASYTNAPTTGYVSYGSTPTRDLVEYGSAPTSIVAPTAYPWAPTAAPTEHVREPTEYARVPTAAPTEYAREPTAAPTEYARAPTAAPTEYARAPTAAPTEYARAPTSAPTAAPTELPSWPYHVGASGASCAQACVERSLVCDEEGQESTTYGRAVAFEALRRAGVPQKMDLEDEWQGGLRVRDGYNTTDSGQMRSMPGLWMHDGRGTPNWKNEANRSVQSTCSASYAGLRRVCVCKLASAESVPSTADVAKAEPAPSVAPAPRDVVSSGLVVHVSAASYAGSVNTIANLVSGASPATLHGKWELTTIDSRKGIHFVNDNEPSKNGSCLALPSVTLRTIAMWIYISHFQDDMRFLLDGRSNGPFVTNKTGAITEEIDRGATYINGTARPLSDVAALLQTRSSSWQHLAFVMSVRTLDTSVKIFARYSMHEGLDATLGSVQLYDRALSAAEIRQCYEASF